MRLIDTKTLHIKEFTGPKAPRYAILSHTWGDEELTYQDWLYVHEQSPKRWGWVQLPEEIQRLKSTAGYVKVLKACEYARQHNSNCQWLWADTVCIDKSSSAELSEAINSMFEWYRRAEVCYALLVDVPPLSRDELAKCSYRTSPFRQSRWFRRGWTLQELVAPWSVVFLSQDWTLLGTKKSLAKHIATITSIPESCLSGNWDRIREQTSIAQKMSWAAWRQTTRIEDQAYCLMGLFEINMPLLYGEGGKAFLRLQQEIIKQTRDLSFLAWQSKRSQTFAQDHFIHWGLPTLAYSPSRFSSAKNIKILKTPELLATKRVFAANTGTIIHRPVLATLDPSFVFAPLNAQDFIPSRSAYENIWIPLVRNGPSAEFTRSSFPASTISTALNPARCVRYTGEPSETCLLPLIEPSPRRHYFRLPKLESNKETGSCRRVGVMPIFATPVPGLEVDMLWSYPFIPKAGNSLIFTLAEVEERIHHGIMALRVPTDIKDPSNSSSSNTVAVHFLVVFDDETSRPRFWKAEEVVWPGIGGAFTAGQEKKTYQITNSIILPKAREADRLNPSDTRPDIEPISYVRENSKGQIDAIVDVLPRREAGSRSRARNLGKLGVFVEMDCHWYMFRSAGLEEISFQTHINLVMIGWNQSDKGARKKV